MGRIGIMGGTFDPIHKGHLLLGRHALKEYRLDQVWYMPSGQPPHKRDHDITDVKDRLAMVELAIRHDPDFLLSDFETSREGNTYTAQTLRLLKEAYPQHEFFFIIGADSLYEIEYWYHPEKIIGVVPILVADRAWRWMWRPRRSVSLCGTDTQWKTICRKRWRSISFPIIYIRRLKP